MDIILGGHLDRALLLGTKPGRFQSDGSTTAPLILSDDPYRAFFHCAGMMAILSDGVVRIDESSLHRGPALTRRDATGQTYGAVAVPDLEDDALRFAKVVVQSDILSDDSLAYAKICAKNDPHEPNVVHHVEGLMFSILHTWRTKSTLVISAGDRSIMSEIADGVSQKGIALPFGIPDLRSSTNSPAPASGAIPNLEPNDVVEVNVLRNDPVLKSYRQRLGRLSGLHRDKVANVLQSAFDESRRSSERIAKAAADITLMSTRAKMLDNSDLPRILLDPFGWAGTQTSRHRMHVIVLSNGRRLN